jgi:hypothetical protein
MVTLLETVLFKALSFVGIDAAKIPFERIKRIYGQAQGRSLIETSKNTRVRPITVISNDLMTLPELDNVLLNILNIFTAYYMQAIAVNNTINSVTVRDVLYKFNPNASVESLNNPHRIESNYEFTLPGIAQEASTILSRQYETDKNDTLKENPNLSVGKLININISENYVTAISSSRTSIDTSEKNDTSFREDAGGSNSAKRDDMGNIIDRTNTSQNGSSTTTGASKTEGKRVENSINNQFLPGSYNIPVLVQLASFLLSTETCSDLISTGSVGKSLLDRWVQYRSGQIEFIKDLILCNDIIDEQRRLLLHKESDTYMNILKRIGTAQLNYINTDKENLAAASTIYVISEAVAHDIEFKIGGKLESFATRQRLFKGNYGMILAVLDREWERATFYYRGMDVGTTVSFKSLAKSDNKNMDILDVFRTFSSGNSPIF